MCLIQNVFTIPLSENMNDHSQSSCAAIFYMYWFSMLFQTDFFTTLVCFVTKCLHENNCHVFPKCLFQKNLNHKFSNYVSYLFNEQNQDLLTIHSFENKHDHSQSSCAAICLYELVQYAFSN